MLAFEPHEFEVIAANTNILSQIRRPPDDDFDASIKQVLPIGDREYRVVDKFKQSVVDMKPRDAFDCGALRMSLRYNSKNELLGPAVTPPPDPGSYLFGYQIEWEKVYPDHPFSSALVQQVYVLEPVR